MNVTDSKRERRVAAVLLLCLLLVAFWEIMARWSRRGFDPFALSAAQFEGFVPRPQLWHSERVPVPFSQTEPNILACRYSLPAAERAPGGHAPAVLVRLVHGFNMVDCMRLKNYTVELLEDTRDKPRAAGASHQRQVWRLTSSTGDSSVWVSSMLRVGDMTETGQDVRSLPFPRMGISTDPNWVPRGMTWHSLRHPWRNFRRMLQHKWNGARHDLLTFLRLRRPVWASEERLTLVSAYQGRPVTPHEEPAVVELVSAVHGDFLAALQQWWYSRPEFENP